MAKKTHWAAPAALVISHNGDGENLKSFLTERGLSFIPAGTGSEGVEAIHRFHLRPGIIIFFLRARSEEDVQVLRVLQTGEHGRFTSALIISEDIAATQRLLGHTKNRWRVLPNFSPDLLNEVVMNLPKQRLSKPMVSLT